MSRMFVDWRNAKSIWMGAIRVALAAALMVSSNAHAEKKPSLETVHVFQPLEGDSPGPLTRASNRIFYGAATYGGASHFGTVFSMDFDGKVKVLHSFDADVDGQYPMTTLLAASDGNLYGTVRYGGMSACGSLFRVSPSTGIYQLMRPFARVTKQSEGCTPSGAMVEGPGGWIYGTTESGGRSAGGTVYKWNPVTGAFKTIRHFALGSTDDGYSPVSVALSSSGRLFGVTYAGGPFNAGTVYSLNADGSDYRLLHSFTNEGAAGVRPYGKLLLAKDGNFYGSTQSGGDCCGAVFRVEPDGAVSAIHTFEFGGDLGHPVGGDLTLGPDGLMYGTTNSGGVDGGGTVFTMSTSGDASVWQSFSYAGTPNSPRTGLTRSGAYMYGTASFGYNEGTLIYRVLKK
jgi:uncharacterized repeat protein (TIGR03803 family)